MTPGRRAGLLPPTVTVPLTEIAGGERGAEVRRGAWRPCRCSAVPPGRRAVGRFRSNHSQIGGDAKSTANHASLHARTTCLRVVTSAS